MPIEVRLPELAESMSSATVTAWLKEVGDRVTEGEPIAEVETDKTTVELEAPATGVIEAIQVSAGTADVAVGAVLALLREPSPAEAPVPAAPRSPVAPRPPPAARASRPAETAAEEQAPPTAAVRPLDAVSPAAPEVPATPLARRMAELANLDLAGIRGTGEGGRVGKADVQRALLAGSVGTVGRAAPQAVAPGAGLPAGEPPLVALPTIPHRDEPLTAARRVTAARMTQAKQTAPHFYLEVDCSVDPLLEQLERARAAGGGDSRAGTAELTLTDLLVRATALALARVPLANSAWTGNAVRVFEAADVAVAVATPAGLLTPVVRNAGAKDLAGVAAELRDLTARARDGRLQPSEYAGGTFTISNLGMYGVSRLYPILNPPQSCILGIGAVESRPVVRDGQVAAGRTMAVTLSADHRAIDGATGATFLRELRAIIEHPDPIFE